MNPGQNEGFFYITRHLLRRQDQREGIAGMVNRLQGRFPRRARSPWKATSSIYGLHQVAMR